MLKKRPSESDKRQPERLAKNTGEQPIEPNAGERQTADVQAPVTTQEKAVQTPTNTELPPEHHAANPKPPEKAAETKSEDLMMIGIVETKPGDDRPHMTVRINNHDITGLLDSGASITVMGERPSWLDTNKEKRIHRPIRIRTADGTSYDADNCYALTYNYNGIAKEVDTYVLPSLRKQLILGNNFWQAYDIRPVMLCCELVSEKPEVIDVEHKLPKHQKDQLQAVIQTFNFAQKGETLGHTTLIKHQIDTGDEKPIKQRPYVVSPYIQKQINEEIDRMLEKDIIEKVSQPTWLNPIVAVKKPSGKIRICLDARKLNDVTVKTTYPQQNANRILSQLEGTQYLSAIDLTDAFYQILLDEESRQKTAFAISSRGTFMYKRMPMGLCNSGSTLCELVESVFGCELEPYAFPYLDDFIVATDSFEKHVEILSKVAEKLRRAGLQISKEKSRFCMRRLKYLGHVIDKNGISADYERIKPIVEYPTPQSVKDVRRVLGMAGWYRRFIKNYADITSPINDLTKKKHTKFVWTQDAQASFEALKEALTSTPILATPRYDLPFRIECDASDTGIGAVLLQDIDGQERVIAYMSAKLTAAQRKYHITERECLAVILAIEKFRPYVEGGRFTVITDHASLLWLSNIKDPTGRLARWALRLQAFNFELIHRKGKHMVVPDALSRTYESVELLDLTQLALNDDPEYIALRHQLADKSKRTRNYKLEDNVIYRRIRTGSQPGWKIFVPANKRGEVLKECHDDPLAMHGGQFKTLRRLRTLYYWPNMTQDARTHVQRCDTCKQSKASNQDNMDTNAKYYDYEQPWKSISTDIIGPLPKTKAGNRQLLVVVDNLSKYVLLKPMKAATAEEIVRFIRDDVFYRYGVPNTLKSDNGKQFVSKVFHDFLSEHNVTHWRTPNYHPQANPTEAANKTIGNALRVTIKEGKHDNWDNQLPEIARAINTSVHTSTMQTPHYVLFGREYVPNGNRYINLNDDEAENVRFNASELHKKVAENLQKAHERAQRPQRQVARTFKPGDIVWRKNFTLSNAGERYAAKLAPKYVRCTIIKQIGTNTYELDENGKRIGVYSTADLKSN